MKIVHISDTHIHDHPVMESDPVENFRDCVRHVMEFHADADRVVITGDLAHCGFERSYRELRALLEDAGLSGRLRPRLVIGNHDDRESFARVFPEVERDENGFIQYTERTPIGLLVFLDTLEPGTHEGHYCEKRQAWLRKTLDEASRAGDNVWLFMHHHPMRVHVANADMMGLVHLEAFHAILSEHRDRVRHIFFGHCHFSLSGSVLGIPVSAPRSTNHPNWPEFTGDPYRLGYAHMDRNYNLCFLDVESTVVHSVDFQSERKAIWVETQEDGWLDEGVLNGVNDG